MPDVIYFGRLNANNGTLKPDLSIVIRFLKLKTGIIYILHILLVLYSKVKSVLKFQNTVELFFSLTTDSAVIV